MLSPSPLRFVCTVVLSLLATTATFSDNLELNRYFSDHMVLQREQPVTIKGMADAGTTVTVNFAGQTKSTKTTSEGTWSVELDAMSANAVGQSLTVESSAGGSVTLRDVVVGDVILFARQTSVDVSLGKDAAGRQVAAEYQANPNYRAISIQTIASKKPQRNLIAESTRGWGEVTPERASSMSAAAFYLGRDLARAISEVPIGIVDLNMGPYFAIGWMSLDTLDAVATNYNDKEIRWMIEQLPKQAEQWDNGEAHRNLDAYYARQVEDARKRNNPPPAKPSLGLSPLADPIFPAAGYNAVLSPLSDIDFKAVVLQLGADYPYIPYRRLAEEGLAQTRPELNQAWAQNYRIMKNGYRTSPRITPQLIGAWRQVLGDEELAIGLVTPPSSDLFALAEHNREMRELHRRMARDNANTGIIMPGMDSVAFSGQPVDEQLLADRAGRWLRADVYQKPGVVASGPIVDRVDSYLTDATVYFKPGTAEGLQASPEALNSFEVAAPGGPFLPATAKIVGDTVKLHCSEVPQIEFVRFDWKSKPTGGLTNAAGLPAIPFNTSEAWDFMWYYQKDMELPQEYFITADQWGDSDVAIINGEIEYIVTGDSEQTPRRPGPLGIFTSPFGPNLYVISIDPGSPAVGKVLPGDIVYGINGEKFVGPDDPMYFQIADAITESETESGGGKVELMIRRGKELIRQTLDIGVLGSYSPTSPFYCGKSDMIAERAKQWSYDRFRPEKGVPQNATGMLHTDLWFLMASGDPKVQGLVRRAVYDILERQTPLRQPDPNQPAHNWNIGYDAIVIGEYFHATGDPNVLPYLENLAGWAAVTQIKEAGDQEVSWEVAQADEHVGGWRQRYNPTGADRWKSGYGLMPPAGTACVKAMVYAKEAGLPIDEEALQRGIRHFRYKRGEHAFVEYLYWNLRRDAPFEVNPQAEANGKLSSMNGKLGQAAAMFRLIDDHQPKDICARYCVYAYNNTRYGHGGMYFNNMWTPIGAHAAGDRGFQHFMQGQRWWRELFRRHDGSFNQVGRGGIGVGYALPYVAANKRLRILGAPRSAFGTNAPDYLKPAVEAHRDRDYAKAQALTRQAMKNNTMTPEEREVVEHFLESVRILQASIEHDLTYVEQQIKQGNYDYAQMEIPQLQGVVAADNARLQAILKKLESPEVQAAMRNLRIDRNTEADAIKRALQADMPAKVKHQWQPLTTWRIGNKTPQDATVWKMKLVEDRKQAPVGWTKPGFDDSDWDNTTLPISWAMYHSVLFRTQVKIDDKSRFDDVRIRGSFFQQGNVMVYINGELVAKIDNIGRGAGESEMPLTPYAMEMLRNGENTIAVTTKHNRRWGPLRGEFTSVSNDGFGIAFDARIKD